MSELELIRERIAYLKVWLGIMVVTDISLFGWLITNFGSAPPRIAQGCIAAIIAITAAILGLHVRIGGYIEKLRDL